MRQVADNTWFWNTRQGKICRFFTVFLFIICTTSTPTKSDFLDDMSRQFFGLANDGQSQPNQQHYKNEPDPFQQMFGSASQPVNSRPPPPPNHHYANTARPARPPHGHVRPLQGPVRPPHRQGYYPIQQASPYPTPPGYDGPQPVYGQQQGFGQRRPDTNDTETQGYPADARHPHHPPPTHYYQEQNRHPYPPVEYHQQHHPPATVVDYQQPPETIVEYQQPAAEYPHDAVPHQVEYHHVPQQPAVVEEHHGTAIEIHTNGGHHHEPHEHVEYHHHPPEIEHHTIKLPKPKRFQLSYNQPSPDLKIVDKHLRLPPVKFRFHINPKIVITSNTKDPLEKKHHDDEHDLEPFPPPDAFSDPETPPSYNRHVVEHYPVEHHYPVDPHYPASHYPVEYAAAKHYPVEHRAIEHHAPPQEYTYDLSHGHSHLNPHRSHYEPTFKIKTKPIIFTEPPPTRPTTTRRPTTTTARTTTTTTTTTTTARPRTRARLNARNPGFSVAFTQGSTTATTPIERQGDITTASTTTRRSIFRSSSERERESDGIAARKDEMSSIVTSSTTQPTTTSTTSSTTPRTTTTTTLRPTTTTTTTTTTPKPTTTTTTPKPTTTTTTMVPTTTTTMSTTSSTSTFAPTTSRSTTTPAEETTSQRSSTLSIDTNEIDMRKATESPRRRLEPLQEGSSFTSGKSETVNIESSESVKVIETTMLIDGKNQTVRFYYITQPVKFPLDVFQKMTGQSKDGVSGMKVIKLRDKRYVVSVHNKDPFSQL